MGADSKIEWTHHTFNPWWGCLKVSPGCQHCYAETLSNRYGHNIWGPAKTTERRLFGDKHWTEPLKWNKAAQAAGERARVFCASMADVFEEHPALIEERFKLWHLIDNTPALDWLLLTKRPENVMGYLPAQWTRREMPANVWIGTSVENQEEADRRIPHLMRVPAKVRFLSCEPLLGPVDLGRIPVEGGAVDALRGARPAYGSIGWVICGGESGPKARPMHPVWVRSLRDQCQAAGVPFFMKQWGEYQPITWREAFERSSKQPRPAFTVSVGGRSCYTQIGDILGFHMPDEVCMERVGKHAAGRLLDGRAWDEFPSGGIVCAP